MIALVIPSHREDQILAFLEAWQDQLKEANVKTYIVEDAAEKSFKLNDKNYYQLNHLCWQSAPQELLDCIHVNSPGCRSIGFWKAYQEECDIIVTLDDDVRPVVGENIFTQFHKILIDGLPVWVDPLLNYKSRGYPNQNVGSVPVAFHVGSFLGIPDVDGETQLRYEKDFTHSPPKYNSKVTIVPHGQLIPVNGGICGWKRELTPYVHYSLWHQELGYRRFDDIWMGIILKKFLDLSGLRMSFGPPLVNHFRASDAEQNFAYEVKGKHWNEIFWQEFDECVSKITLTGSESQNEIFKMLCECLKNMNNAWAQKEGAAMSQWHHLFSANVFSRDK